MQLTTTLFATLLSATAALAAPAAGSVSMMAAVPEWTIESMKRVCNSGDTTCTYTFTINTHSGTATSCKFIHNGKPASQTSGGPGQCGRFSITSGWSGQFGPGNGFTTLSVVDNTHKLIVWPAYTDKQLQGGKVVKPDQSYAPAALP